MTNRRLLLEDDGLHLHGYVFEVRRRADPRLLGRAEARAGDREQALDAILARLDTLGPRPRRALVLAREAVAALERLPLPPGRPRPRAEMERLVRWELEPVFAQRAGAPPLDALLRRLGYLTREQAREAASRPGRIEENVRALGIVTEAQLRECHALQERLNAQADDYACAWAPQGRTTDGAPGSFWLLAGVPRPVRTRWAGLLHARDVRLDGIYPLLGCAVAALRKGPQGARTVLEIGEDAACAATVGEAGLTSFVVAPLGQNDSVASLRADLVAPGATRETLVCGRRTLDTRLDSGDSSVVALEPPVEAEGATADLAGPVGALRHATGDAPAWSLARLPARDPAPPLRERPLAWWAAAAVLALILVASIELLLGLKANRSRAELDAAMRDVTELERSAELHAQRAESAATLRARLAEADTRATELQRRLEGFGEPLEARRTLLPGLLDALAASATPDIMLSSVAEEKPGWIRIEGWGLHERSFPIFARALAGHLEAVPAWVVGREVRAETRNGVEGFAFAIALTTDRPSEEEQHG